MSTTTPSRPMLEEPHRPTSLDRTGNKHSRSVSFRSVLWEESTCESSSDHLGKPVPVPIVVRKSDKLVPPENRCSLEEGT